MPSREDYVERGGRVVWGKVGASREKQFGKCHTNVAGKLLERDHVQVVENLNAPKIRYEEASTENMVYFPGKNGGTHATVLSDDLHEEWVIGEERPWWYFRL
jgi:hypothetical protein